MVTDSFLWVIWPNLDSQRVEIHRLSVLLLQQLIVSFPDNPSLNPEQGGIGISVSSVCKLRAGSLMGTGVCPGTHGQGWSMEH